MRRFVGRALLQLRKEKDSSATISTTRRMPAGVTWLAGSTVDNTMMLCQLLGGSSKQNLVSLYVIMLTNDDTVDCGMNLYSVVELFEGWEINQNVYIMNAHV